MRLRFSMEASDDGPFERLAASFTDISLDKSNSGHGVSGLVAPVPVKAGRKLLLPTPVPIIGTGLTGSRLPSPGIKTPPLDGASIAAMPSSNQSIDDISIKRMSMLAVNTYNDEFSKSAHATPQAPARYYVCPSNTIVASNGDVYHVEPFQL